MILSSPSCSTLFTLSSHHVLFPHQFSPLILSLSLSLSHSLPIFFLISLSLLHPLPLLSPLYFFHPSPFFRSLLSPWILLLLTSPSRHTLLLPPPPLHPIFSLTLALSSPVTSPPTLTTLLPLTLSLLSPLPPLLAGDVTGGRPYLTFPPSWRCKRHEWGEVRGKTDVASFLQHLSGRLGNSLVDRQTYTDTHRQLDKLTVW